MATIQEEVTPESFREYGDSAVCFAETAERYEMNLSLLLEITRVIVKIESSRDRISLIACVAEACQYAQEGGIQAKLEKYVHEIEFYPDETLSSETYKTDMVSAKRGLTERMLVVNAEMPCPCKIPAKVYEYYPYLAPAVAVPVEVAPEATEAVSTPLLPQVASPALLDTLAQGMREWKEAKGEKREYRVFYSGYHKGIGTDCVVFPDRLEVETKARPLVLEGWECFEFFSVKDGGSYKIYEASCGLRLVTRGNACTRLSDAVAKVLKELACTFGREEEPHTALREAIGKTIRAQEEAGLHPLQA